jgi:hypothetical protein
MPTTIHTCPQCAHSSRVSPERLGRVVRCPKCRTASRVSAPPADEPGPALIAEVAEDAPATPADEHTIREPDPITAAGLETDPALAPLSADQPPRPRPPRLDLFAGLEADRRLKRRTRALAALIFSALLFGVTAVLAVLILRQRHHEAAQAGPARDTGRGALGRPIDQAAGRDKAPGPTVPRPSAPARPPAGPPKEEFEEPVPTPPVPAELRDPPAGPGSGQPQPPEAPQSAAAQAARRDFEDGLAKLAEETARRRRDLRDQFARALDQARKEALAAEDLDEARRVLTAKEALEEGPPGEPPPAMQAGLRSPAAKKAWDEYQAGRRAQDADFDQRSRELRTRYAQVLDRARQEALARDDLDEAQRLLAAKKALLREPEPPDPIAAARAARSKRWRMAFNYGDESEYVRQLHDLKAQIGFPVPGDPKSVYVVQDLTVRPAQLEKVPVGRINRIFWTSTDPRTVLGIYRALQLPPPTGSRLIFYTFLPQEHEEELVKIELKYGERFGRKKEEDMAETIFKVEFFGQKPVFSVMEQRGVNDKPAATPPRPRR